MSAHSRPRRPSLRTRVLLVLFALGLVMQPLASALGELHGALAHADGISAHAGHVGAPHDDAHVDHDDGDVAHVLLHVAHCCGHAQAMPAGELAGLAARIDALPFPMLDVTHASPHTTVALRPPIHG